MTAGPLEIVGDDDAPACVDGVCEAPASGSRDDPTSSSPSPER